MHHKDKHAFHERKRKRDAADASARTGEELTWLPKEPVLHQEVHYREGPRNPHGHEATALPPPVQTPWPQELTIANDKVSFTVKVESSNIGTQKMLHYRSAGNLHLTSSEVGQEKVHLNPSLLLMTFQENLRLDSNDCTITTLAVSWIQLNTHLLSVCILSRCSSFFGGERKSKSKRKRERKPKNSFLFSTYTLLLFFFVDTLPF